MPLLVNTNTNPSWNLYAEDIGGDQRDAALLDRYLAIVETNKQSCKFVPDDALLALDMVSFVRGQLNDGLLRPQMSVKRLVMALVKPGEQGEIQ